MLMFYADMESDAKTMSDLSHVRAALLKMCEDMQKIIDRKEHKKPCNGTIRDQQGNPIGEWDMRLLDD